MFRKLYRDHEVALVLDISQGRAYALAREGVLPHVHLGRQIHVDSTILEEFIKNGDKALSSGWKREA